METWAQVTAKKPFITDLGEENEKKEQTVCRFAVWLPEDDTEKHRIAEVSDNLERLKQKYKVTPEFIFRVNHSAH